MPEGYADELLEIKEAIQAVWANEVEGVIRSEGLLEGLPEFPMTVTYLVRGTPRYSQGRGCLGLHYFQSDLHLSRSVLPNDEAETIPFILLAIKAFARRVTLGGLCEHCLLQEYIIGGFNYGSETRTYGIRWTIEVKVKHSGITVSA